MEPAMIRSPGARADPCVSRNERTTAAVAAGSSVSRPSAATSPFFVTVTRTAQGSTPGTSAPNTTPRWKTLPARIASRSSKGRSRSTSSRAGASPATSPRSPTRMATSTSTAGAVQPDTATVAPSGDTPVSVR